MDLEELDKKNGGKKITKTCTISSCKKPVTAEIEADLGAFGLYEDGDDYFRHLRPDLFTKRDHFGFRIK